jgi:hypothetical protein
MTEDELRTKFESLVAPYLDAAELKAFAGGLLSLEQADNIRALLNLSTSQPVMSAIVGGQT